MSIHQQVQLGNDWRKTNIDALYDDSPINFDTSTLRPAQPEITVDDVGAIRGQVMQLKQAGDTIGALRGCLETPVYNGTDAAKEAHMKTILEVLQHTSAAKSSELCKQIYNSDGGKECLDVLMKYIYKGMAKGQNSDATSRTPSKVEPQATGFSQMSGRPGASEPSTQAFSVLLSWHEKVVEVAGQGCIVRVMTDWRRV